LRSPKAKVEDALVLHRQIAMSAILANELLGGSADASPTGVAISPARAGCAMLAAGPFSTKRALGCYAPHS
jgi:hypothetical protein